MGGIQEPSSGKNTAVCEEERIYSAKYVSVKNRGNQWWKVTKLKVGETGAI